jgi:hypothetical protein
MKIDLQDRVCAFVRDIISARTHENIQISSRPERDHRNVPVVEELWEAPTRRYAIEHTRVEAFEGQIANLSRIERLLLPVKRAIADGLPGYFLLSVRERDLAAARFNERTTQVEIARLVIETAGAVRVGETVVLRSPKVPFTLELYLRHKDSSALILYSDIEGDPDELRLGRIRRALDAKCPKLKAWSDATDGTSVLVLESNDIQLSNGFKIYDAVERALRERVDQADIVVLVETDITPMNAWVLKEGDKYGDDVPTTRTGGYCYTEGSVRD